MEFIITLAKAARVLPKPGEMAHYCRSLLHPIAAPSLLRRPLASSPSTPSPPSAANLTSSKPPALSARLSFVFDELDRSRSSDLSVRDAALRRIQSWHRPPMPPPVVAPLEPGSVPVPVRELDGPKKETEVVAVTPTDEVERISMEEVLRREVELVHPWPEWIELMEQLAQQRYFDLGGASGANEGSLASDMLEIQLIIWHRYES
jgi:hypothetical protein